ncbi:tryptophan halogenase family protein [uncultured Gilvimarinus sp.]|uniref:tryptophan halogenase family protein n=1 Tax=uncultured Gilvimarinus sp. TaxID=1689143 RepID=UPI0030EE4283|tara:strand:- start:556 stop:2121 length:1566 start_codon:yes stop_codon:yes gene_type:complete
MTDTIKKIVILGGGTAGWITAGLLAAEHAVGSDPGGIQIVVLESPDVAPIGVGEGTWPSMRDTLKKIGINETEFIRTCNVSFKQGSKFVGWSVGQGEHYYHPFTLPSEYGAFNLAPYWSAHKDKVSFAGAVCAQEAICEMGLAPKQMATPEYAYVLNYGYHLDSAKFSELLRNHCVQKLSIEHQYANVVSVDNDVDGYIQALCVDTGSRVEGDLFVDCSGFKSLLLGEHFGIASKSLRKILVNDSVIATQAPYTDSSANLASCTIGTAQPSGWVWDIALPSRRGVGYVYSSAHASATAAENTVREYLEASLGAEKVAKLELRHIKFEPGYRKTFWHKNCIAIGLSAGFIEPLEATALVLVERSAQMLAEELPRSRQSMAVVSRRFNTKFTLHWERIVDFLKLHYALSKRADSDYWVDQRSSETLPDSLNDLLTLWRERPPWLGDEMARSELFPSASFQYVLYGMRPDLCVDMESRRKSSNENARALELFQENQNKINKLIRGLQKNRALLTKISNSEFAKI